MVKLQKKRKVLLTGATGSLGAALAKKFIKDKFELVTTSLSPNSESDVHFICDLADPIQLTLLCQEIQKLRIDIVINNAGINVVQPFQEVSRLEIEQSLQINLVAPMLLTQAALPNMLANSWGRVVNVGSILGQISRPGRSNYSTSKAGLAGFTRALSAEFAGRGITSNYVAPGYLESKLTRKNLNQVEIQKILERIPLNRLGSTDEVADLIKFLCSEDASFISGQVMTIDGGQVGT